MVACGQVTRQIHPTKFVRSSSAKFASVKWGKLSQSRSCTLESLKPIFTNNPNTDVNMLLAPWAPPKTGPNVVESILLESFIGLSWWA